MTTPSCRFCYSYKPQGFIQPYCPPIVSATNQTLSSISSIPSIVNNNVHKSEGILLLASQRAFAQCAYTATNRSTVQSTISNATAINSTIYSQLLDVRTQRYTPYQPYIYPLLPSSVIDLQMATANVGNPMPPMTIFNCKRSQFVTK
jgi:hypothetical protein